MCITSSWDVLHSCCTSQNWQLVYKLQCVFHSDVIVSCWHFPVTFVQWAKMDLHALLIDLMLCICACEWMCLLEWVTKRRCDIILLYLMAAFWILCSREFNESFSLLIRLELYFIFWHLTYAQCTIDNMVNTILLTWIKSHLSHSVFYLIYCIF